MQEPASPQQHRSALRHPIRTRAKLASSSVGAVPVTVVDISAHGCKCERTRAPLHLFALEQILAAAAG